MGAATARALAEHGVGVDFVPAETSSAVGMLEEWPERIEEPGLEGRQPPAASGAPRALLPVSALASTTLEEGLRAKGYRVWRARAYDMVPAPAPRPLSRIASEPDDAPELDRTAARAACASGELAAVVVTAPSRAAELLDGVAVSFGDFRLSALTVLKALVQHAREPLTRDKLMNLARGREYSAMERSIDVQISRLRRMVEEDPAHPRYIQTVWGLGYVFVPDGSKA